MYRNTAKPHTEYGQHNRPHKVTLSALKTKHKYIHINNPECFPAVCRTEDQLHAPFRATAAVCDTKSMGILQRSVIVHCPGKSEFFLQGPGERRASQITPYQFISSGWSRFRVSFIVYWATEQTAGIRQIHWSLHRSMYGSVGQSVFVAQKKILFTEAHLL